MSFKTLEEAVKAYNGNTEVEFQKLGEWKKEYRTYHLVLVPARGDRFLEVYIEDEGGFRPFKSFLTTEVVMALLYWEESSVKRLEDKKWKEYELSRIREVNNG